MLFICLKIFLARIVDVSLGTIRTVLVVKGKNLTPAIVAFFEVLVWFYAAREALNTEIAYILIPIFYAGGYATGTYIGTFISTHFVEGLIGVQVITKQSKEPHMLDEIRAAGFGVSVIDLKKKHEKSKKDMLIIHLNKSKLKKLTKITLFIIVIGFICYGGIYLYAWMSPKLTVNSAKSYYFYDKDENLITGTDEWISYENLDEDIINATIAIEDRHFFTHHGFDFLRIAKALSK